MEWESTTKRMEWESTIKNGVGKYYKQEWSGKVDRAGMEGAERDGAQNTAVMKGSYRKLMPASLRQMLKLQRIAVRNILTGTAKCDCQFFEKLHLKGDD